MERLLFTLNGSVRYEMMDGRRHIVAPTVMIVEGVVPGSNGPLLYLREDMKKKVPAWDHRPVVVYHPSKAGKPSTAADPTVLTKQKIGITLNSKYEEKTGKKPKLKTEVWLDEEKARKFIPEIVEKIERGEPVEVSTGLFTENEKKSGTFDGKEYKAVAHEYVPDHLAILPTGKGACSVADGAGINMNSETVEETETSVANAAPCCNKCGGKMVCNACAKGGMTHNAMSHGRLHNKLQKELDTKHGKYRAGVQDVYPGFVVYSKSTGDNGSEFKTYKHEYSVNKRKSDGDEVSLKGEPEEVQKVTEYRTMGGDFVGNALLGFKNVREGNDMADEKETMVKSIIANSGGLLDDTDKDWLLKKPEDWLKTLPGGGKVTPVANATPPVVQPVPVVAPVPAKQMTFQELLTNADPATRELIEDGLATSAAEKNALIETITANAANKFTKEELGAFDKKALRKMVAFVTKEEPVSRPHYAGAAGVIPFPTVNHQQGAGATPPSLPTPPSTAPKKQKA